MNTKGWFVIEPAFSIWARLVRRDASVLAFRSSRTRPTKAELRIHASIEAETLADF